MSIIRDFVELVRNLTANLNLKVDKSSVTSGNTASTVVSRDASGNFSAGTIIAALNGTAANASKLLNMNWAWSGQGGQPTWLWGGSDGTNVYVYNPANFSVNYATTAGTANVANSITYSAAAYGAASLATGEIGTYAFLTRNVVGQNIDAGVLYAGSELFYSGVEEDGYNDGLAYDYLSQGGNAPGTWKAMGSSNSGGAYAATLFLRIA